MKRAILNASIFFSIITVQYFYNNYAKALEQVTLPNMDRATELIGMNVRNLQSEYVGKIADVALDLETGRIAYAVLSSGGFLGVGDKLFAIPLRALKFSGDHSGFILNVDKSKLESAPSLNSKHWPDAQNTQWIDEMNQYYEKEGRITGSENIDNRLELKE